MNNRQNVKAALLGETFDERFVLFAPVIGGIFFFLLSFSLANHFCNSMVAIWLCLAVSQFVDEIAFRLDEFSGFPKFSD